MNVLGIYTVGVARSLYRRLLLDIVIVNCPIVMVLSITYAIHP